MVDPIIRWGALLELARELHDWRADGFQGAHHLSVGNPRRQERLAFDILAELQPDPMLARIDLFDGSMAHHAGGAAGAGPSTLAR